MQLRFEWLALYVAVAALYLLLAWREWSGQRPGSERAPLWHGVVLALALVLHGTLLMHGMFESGELRFGFAHALSATLWITALIVCVETMFSPSRGMFLLVLPLGGRRNIAARIVPRCDRRQVKRRALVSGSSAAGDSCVQLADDRRDSCAADGDDGAAAARGWRSRALDDLHWSSIACPRCWQWKACCSA